MRTELVPQLPVLALGEQMLIQFTEHHGEGVRVADFPVRAVMAGAAQRVADVLLCAIQLRDEKTSVIHALGRPLTHPTDFFHHDGACAGLENADDKMSGLLMQSQQCKWIAMVGAKERCDGCGEAHALFIGTGQKCGKRARFQKVNAPTRSRAVRGVCCKWRSSLIERAWFCARCAWGLR